METELGQQLVTIPSLEQTDRNSVRTIGWGKLDILRRLLEQVRRKGEERTQVQMIRDDYLDKLKGWSLENYANVLSIIEGLENRDQSIGGSLVAIGSSVVENVDKLKGRYVKDIDLKVLAGSAFITNKVNRAVIEVIKGSGKFNVKPSRSRVAHKLNELRDTLDLLPLQKSTGADPVTPLHVILFDPEWDEDVDYYLAHEKRKFVLFCSF